MEEQIKRVVKSQKIQYISFWIIPLLLVLLGEAGVLPVGIKADNVRAVYVFGNNRYFDNGCLYTTFS